VAPDTKHCQNRSSEFSGCSECSAVGVGESPGGARLSEVDEEMLEVQPTVRARSPGIAAPDLEAALDRRHERKLSQAGGLGLDVREID